MALVIFRSFAEYMGTAHWAEGTTLIHATVITLKYFSSFIVLFKGKRVGLLKVMCLQLLWPLFV